MIYGLYLSATGVLTNSYRQDVISNNIANAETVGFKKDLALFQQRPTAAQEAGNLSASNRLLESLGGGIFASPTRIDTSQGDLEPTSNSLDIGIQGNGYFKVSDGIKTNLTRDGRFMLDYTGHLVMGNHVGQQVLDQKDRPIQFDLKLSGKPIAINEQGVITQQGKPVGTLGLYDVTDSSKLQKQGGNLMSHPDVANLRPANGIMRGGFIEHANVEPATELALLMDSQRQLEANANMIRYQDQTLARLVNDVGKIS